MEFKEVLGFLFIFQKILYLGKQRNRDLFQCRLYLKKPQKTWWMLFCSLQLLHSEITYFTLKWGDGVWKKWRTLLVLVQLTLYPYIPAWAAGASRTVLMSVEGATYMSVSFLVFSLKPLFFDSPSVKGDLQALLLTIQIFVQPLAQMREETSSMVM